MAESVGQPAAGNAARGWTGAAAVSALFAAVAATISFFQVSAVLAVIDRMKLGVTPAGIAQAWWWGGVPLVAAVACLFVAYGLVRGRAWAWYAAVAIAVGAALGAGLLLVAGVRMSGAGFAAIGKFYTLLFGAALAAASLVMARSLRSHGPGQALPIAAPRTGLVIAPVIAALVVGLAANAFEGAQAASNAADEDAMIARLAGVTIDVNLESAVTRAATAEVRPGSGEWLDVEVVERLTLELVMSSTSDVELADVGACLRTALPTRDPTIGSVVLLRPVASTDQVTELCWDHVDLNSALDEVFGAQPDGVLRLGAGDHRSVIVELERDASSCDYPAGPWVLEIRVLPLGRNPEFDPYFDITPSVDGLPEVAFEVATGVATGSIGETNRYCAALE